MQMTQTTVQFKIDKAEKEQVFQIFRNLGFTPSQAMRLFFKEVQRTKKLPISGYFIEPNEERREQAMLRLFKNMDEIAQNPPEALKNLTLEELNKMIDEEREALYQEQLKKKNA